jgi:hypothetical protein
VAALDAAELGAEGVREGRRRGFTICGSASEKQQVGALEELLDLRAGWC